MSLQTLLPVSHNVNANMLRRMLADGTQSTAINRQLTDRAELVKARSAATGIPLSILGTAPLFDGAKLVTRTMPNWALFNLSHDPLWQDRKFPIPAKYFRRLNTLYHAGVEFDALYVAHELPLDFQPDRDRLGLRLVAPSLPVKAVRLAHGLGLAADSILATYAAIIRKPINALAAAGATSLSILRDPVLMGVVVPPSANPEAGAQAIWFLLAAWRW